MTYTDPDENPRMAEYRANEPDPHPAGEDMGRFEFDGAEGIAFWVTPDKDEEGAVKVMFSELESLAQFLRFNFPGLFENEPPRDTERCTCTWSSEDRGGGYFESVIEPEPGCPIHGHPIADADEIERATRMIYESFAVMGYLLPWDRITEEARERYRNQIRAFTTPPVAATEAVSGYTSHGHRIAWVVQTGRPTSVARCGGPGLCTVCSLEAGMLTKGMSDE